MTGTALATTINRWRQTATSHHDAPHRPGTLLRNEILPADVFLDSEESVPEHDHGHLDTRQRPYHLLHPPTEMISNRKFSYASVREDTGEDTPQSFESSLSSSDLEEVEWIAWPCNQYCKTKGLCSYHMGGTHEEYVQTRLEGYARSNPKKLEKILDELEKRRAAQKLYKLSFASEITRFTPSTSDFGLEVWREKVKKSTAGVSYQEVDEAVLTDDEIDNSPHTDSPEPRQLAPLETLPAEIHNLIFSYVTVDHTADPYARPHVDLASCSLVSKSLHAAAIRVMYRHVSIPQSKAFSKFTRSLGEDSNLGRLVHWLDFSHYSSIGFGRARSTTSRTPYLTPETLNATLDKLPLLQAFLVHEHLDDELDARVIAKLFRMPSVQALDFSACSSKPFAEAFTKVCIEMPWRNTSLVSLGPFSHPLKRLSLHECTTLQEPVFEALLPRLTQLTHLDVAHTMINDKALLSIPNTAKITHLNLERCTRLTGWGVVKFLTTHPAVKNSIVYLNLMADSSRHRLLSEEEVSRILKALPDTIRSLNIGGARVNSTHVPDLRRLASHLEELGLKGANLGMSADINRIFGIEEQENGEAAVPLRSCTLRYIDLTDIRSVTQMSLSYSPTALTGSVSEPLEVIEVGSNVLDELKRRNMHVKNPDWVVRELGRRGWYARQPPAQQQQQQSGTPASIDDGSRPWKMGARWWGMRKIPVVEQDVGGMYGYFMFKRN